MNDNRLWAPWRLDYVKGEADDEKQPVDPKEWLPGADQDCFLCRAAALPADEHADRANLVVRRTDRVVTLLNRFPYSNGHLLVSPRRHVAELSELMVDEQAELMQGITAMVEMLRATIGAHGVNVGLNLGRIAGAGVPGHLHWHLVPRWEGDHNYMATIAGTRIIPQALDAAWELFTSYWQENRNPTTA